MNSFCTLEWVQDQTAHNLEMWQRCAGDWERDAPRYSPRAQRKREQAWDRAQRAVEHHARRAVPSDSARLQRRLVHSFARFGAEALDLGRDSVGVLTEEFLPVGIQLARWAKRFDAELGNADILQACRNAWTACGMQPLLGARLHLTPAILGYSLIYPYSDNYLDQAQVSGRDKHRFSARFRCRLRGESIASAGAHEHHLWDLVGLIEQQFPPSLYPAVFDCLLAIHRAQEASITQIDRCGASNVGEILRISCDKGGTSVLADACLVHGSLTPQEAEFAYAWGVLLQLGDDLQDVYEDLERGSDTLFTHAVRSNQPLDALVAQLLNFSDAVAALLDKLPHGDAEFKSLLRMSWRSLVIMAVAEAHAFFTPAFVAELEVYSAFRFEFLRARRAKLSGKAGLFERLFGILLADEEQGTASLIPQPRERDLLPAPAELIAEPSL